MVVVFSTKYYIIKLEGETRQYKRAVGVAERLPRRSFGFQRILIG